MKTGAHNSQRDGVVLALVLMLMLVLGLLSLTLLSLSANMGIDVSRDLSDADAFWAAEAGLEQAKTLGQMKRKRYTAILKPSGSGTLFGYNVLTGTTGRASYLVSILDDPTWDNSAHTLQKYIITSTGTAQGGRTRVVTLHAWLLNYAGYLNASHFENGVYYVTGDLLDGPVYTDDRLNIMGGLSHIGPVFMGLVSSATNGVNYRENSSNPWTPTTNELNAVWQGGLALNAAPLDIEGQFGDHITDIQVESQSGGLDLEGAAKGDYAFNFQADGSFAYSNMVTQVVQTNQLSALNGTIYVEGNAYVQGVVSGRVTLAARKSINIVSDVVYASASGANPDPWNTNSFNNAAVTDMLGLMAGNTVQVQGSNTINIHASILIATNGFNANYSSTVIGNKFINLFGGLSQYSRGVVGHVPSSGSFQGFHKKYKFDQRYASDAPPSFPASLYNYHDWQ